MTISVAIATYNEEANIKRCLEAVHDWVKEIIIVDGHSSDKTLSIAKEFSKVKTISTTNKAIFHINKQMAINAAKGDWILQLDADEVVTPSLATEIQNTLPQTKFNGFWIKRKNYFLGRFLTKGGVYPDPTIRLYRNGLGRLPCLDVHEQAVIDGPVGWLKNDLLHYSDPSFKRYLTRFDRYTTLLAKELAEKHTSLNFFNYLNYYLVKPTHWFFLAYVRHLGLVDSWQGFLFAFYSALRFPVSFSKYAKNRS